MKLKNQIIVALINAGCSSITAMTIEAASAYRVIKFRRSIAKAFEGIVEKEMELVKDCNLGLGEKGVLNGNPADIKRFDALRAELYKDEQEIETNAISFDLWHELQKENKCLVNPLIEDALEGVLWVAPGE